MKRRSFIKNASVFAGSIAATKLIATPAKAQGIKQLKFKVKNRKVKQYGGQEKVGNPFPIIFSMTRKFPFLHEEFHMF